MSTSSFDDDFFDDLFGDSSKKEVSKPSADRIIPTQVPEPSPTLSESVNSNLPPWETPVAPSNPIAESLTSPITESDLLGLFGSDSSELDDLLGTPKKELIVPTSVPTTAESTEPSDFITETPTSDALVEEAVKSFGNFENLRDLDLAFGTDTDSDFSIVDFEQKVIDSPPRSTYTFDSTEPTEESVEESVEESDGLFRKRKIGMTNEYLDLEIAPVEVDFSETASISKQPTEVYSSIGDVRVLEVPDLHLYDKEVGVTLGLPEQSEWNLKGLLKIFDEEDCDLVMLGGDIQHKRLTNLEFISKMIRLFTELGEKVRTRLEQKGLLKYMRVWDENGVEVDLRTYKSILFSVRGNHDDSTRNPFTFFDALLVNKVIIKPSIVMIGNVQFNFVHYTHDFDKLRIPKRDDAETVIALHHTTLVEEGYLAYQNVGVRINPAAYGIFDDVDLAVINHIHTPQGIREVVYTRADGIAQRTLVCTPGSVGRVAYDDSHRRDYAVLPIITLHDLTSASLGLSKLDLIPEEQYFDKTKVIKVKKSEHAFESFSMELKDVELLNFNPASEIAKLDIDARVKSKCLQLIGDIE